MPEFDKQGQRKVETPSVDDLKVASSHLESLGMIMGDCPETESCLRVSRWLQGEMERVRQVGLLLQICSDINVAVPPGISPKPVPFCQTIRERKKEVTA